MRTRRINGPRAWIAVLLLLCGGAWPSRANAATSWDKQVVDGRHSITLPYLESEIPDAPGRDEYRVVCVTCHSHSYVTLQPAFPERRWTEIVDKMAKIFGAPMDAAQRRAIIGYLVAIQDAPGGAGTGTSPVDGGKQEPEPVAVPLLAFATDDAGRAAELERGAELFRQFCAGCHGSEGRGDGVVAPVLFRQPEDLTAFRFSNQLLERVLWMGSPGTSMPSWRGLPESDLAALASHVRTLHRTPMPDPPSDEALRHGGRVFQQNCAPCHGATGEGNGVAAASLLPAPANFKRKQPDRDFILRVLQTGVRGTGMPSWRGQLSDADRAAAAGYVRSLFEAGE